MVEVKTKGHQGTDKSIVASSHFYVSLLARSDDPHAPWIAAHLAVLDEGAVDIRLEIDLHFFAAVRTGHKDLFAHLIADCGWRIADRLRIAEERS